MLALLVENGQDLELGMRKLLFGHHRREESHEVEAFQRLQFGNALNMLLQFCGVTDMQQRLRDRYAFPAWLRRNRIMLFVDLLKLTPSSALFLRTVRKASAKSLAP